MDPSTTDTHHGHPSEAPHHGRTTDTTDRPQVNTTDTSTDTTDTTDHGHDLPLLVGGSVRSEPDHDYRRPTSEELQHLRDVARRTRQLEWLNLVRRQLQEATGEET